MIKIAICDDEIEAAHSLENAVYQMPFHNMETDVFLSGMELLDRYKTPGEYQILFLDIEMPSVNGIETALKIRRLDPDVILIFMTAYKEYVYQVFEARPFRFLEKPAAYEKIAAALRDAVACIEEMKCYFFYKKGSAVCQVAAKDILYLEASNRKVKIVTKEKEDIFYGKFHKTIEKLNRNIFLQIHSSYIVNMDHIKSFNGKELILINGICLPISLKYRNDACLEHLRFIERRCGEW